MRIRLMASVTLLIPFIVNAQPNYDESKVPQYELPDPLIFVNGKELNDRDLWKGRRAEILDLFSKNVYGTFPQEEAKVTFATQEVSQTALGGMAIRKQVRVTMTTGNDSSSFSLLIYLPAGSKGPVPLFLGLNFKGNHAIHSDPDILITDSWFSGEPPEGLSNKQRAENRGSASSRWPVEQILARGYGLATVYYGDIDPDQADHWEDGVHPLFYKTGQSKPGPEEWGALGAWAWGLSRAMDYLQTDSEIDARQIALLGHSRLGKATTWSGANDTRFNIVVSNDSGCGGAALFRRKFGETAQAINTQFPHWFCDNFKKFNGKEEDLPVDQHMLIALIAPRPVYIASAEDDQWADPNGEFLAGLNARPVYELLGQTVALPTSIPPVGKPVATGSIGYHIRSGKHDLTAYDWERFMDFADYHFSR